MPASKLIPGSGAEPDDREAYEKLLRGHSMTDEELKSLLKVVTCAHEALSRLGPVFYLARKELMERKYQIEDIIEARKSKKG